jgi:7-alpha-hydroxysteroid dehydrogenase
VILDRFKLTDRVAIVTGAGKGIGRGIAVAFAEAGADVVCAARTRADIEATARSVRERGRRALPVPTDVTRTSDLERLVEAALREFGRIDVLVNNAGGTGPRAALDTSEEYFEAALRMNVTQAFLLTRLCVPHMVELAGGGAVVNVSSRSSDMVQKAFVAYGAGKAALNMMTRNLAAEFAPKVRVNAISLGGRGRLRALSGLAGGGLGHRQDLPGGRRGRGARDRGADAGVVKPPRPGPPRSVSMPESHRR